MHEFALGGPDPTCGHPLARNPWNLDHIPGGSSSGSGAAIAAGLCMGTLGSCTGGSIRGPASFCGIVGMKATYGRVSRYGVVPLSWTLDHCGPMTWTVEDSAIMLQAIAGADPKDPTASSHPVPNYLDSMVDDIKGLRIGVPRHFFFADSPSINKDILNTVDAAIKQLEELGAHIEEINVPMLEYAGAAQPVIMLSEAFAYHEPKLLKTPELFGDMVKARFRVGGLFTSSDYVQAQRVRNVLKREFAEVMQSVDVIVSPTSSNPPPTFAEADGMTTSRMPSFTNAELHGPLQSHRHAGHICPLWIYASGTARWAADSGQTFRRTHCVQDGVRLPTKRRTNRQAAADLRANSGCFEECQR